MNFQQENIPPQQNTLVINRSEMLIIKLKVFNQFLKTFNQRTKNSFKSLRLIRQIKKKYHSAFGEPLLTKVVKVDNRFYWRLGTPGFPSESSRINHKNEVNRFFPSAFQMGLRTLLFSITNKCTLNCEHCFEGANLNKKDNLTTNDIIQIVHKYQDFGTTQIMFSGGEPVLRAQDIEAVLKVAKSGTDFWIFTSGFGFELAVAKQLKDAGLTGVIVGLDHFEETKHNEFRGSDEAYEMAIQAIINANDVGLVSALALCATKSFVNESNLTAYMELAKVLGVSFVQFIEPRSKGRYFGRDVELGREEIELLEIFYLTYNSDLAFKFFPIINYLGYNQRRVGCFGAGNRFFYIDSDGDAHLCPYCSGKVGSAIDFSAEKIINMLAQNDCFIFDKNTTF